MGKSQIQGWGLFATKYIERYTILIEYVGELISQVVADEREKLHTESGLHSNYMFKLGENQILDGTFRGNIGRFMNHSCNPNCFSEVICVNGKTKIVLATDRSVLQGEELTYDYMFEYEPEAEQIACCCGAINCRRTLN
eukprot:TRINITY_DN9979_c0_g1_i1.p3 TRINITY_DN9979_c0_g1~~TRINITY_DN9979_c0_g1_i1.p3  ORF type:complete len:139 (-),score=29.15 TRINITY_DN9979_c0_g1_i1:82-498(-)